jgi:AAA+ superfamily predicted ATPase
MKEEKWISLYIKRQTEGKSIKKIFGLDSASKLMNTMLTIKPINGSNMKTTERNDSLTYKKYKGKIVYETMLNMAFYKIFSDYFNMIYQDKKLSAKHGIQNMFFFRQKEFLPTINLVDYWGETDIFFKFKNISINFSFDRYKRDNEVFFTLLVSSKEATNLENEFVFKFLLEKAISLSNLKGSYIEMSRDSFNWKRKEIEKRNFDDIFLPTVTLNDLKLFISVFDQKNKMMKYLMVGSPGTGKTESTLILANELKKRGVTILKTPVCELLKEKLELAIALAPTLIIFDDLDLSIGSRSKGGYSPKELQIFLDAMDGTDKIGENVGIIATTNSVQLLDLAAQRPGRFEKILLFDALSKNNIKNIILKSLKYNFNMDVSNTEKETIELFCHNDIINLFYTNKVTGAHIYNSIKMIKLKMDIFLDENMDLNWILKEIKNDLNIVDKIKKTEFLKDKLSLMKKEIGFGKNGDGEDEDDDEDEEDDYRLAEEVQPEKAKESIRKDSTEQ